MRIRRSNTLLFTTILAFIFTLGAAEMTAQGDQAKGNPPAPANANPLDNEKYRAAIQQYYRENGLQQPQRIMAELQASRILRAVYSERQLQEVMVDFWTNHFNVFAGKGADRWLLPSYDRDTIRPHTMGKFSELLEATAKSPAMLFYLDNFQSVAPNANRNAGPRRQRLLAELVNQQRRRNGNPMQEPVMRQRPAQQRRGINENYARELMELHTMGVGSGYSQADVQELARVLTGVGMSLQPADAPPPKMRPEVQADHVRQGLFEFNPNRHDYGAKTLLGQPIKARGLAEADEALDRLASSPATARFISRKLAMYFVADDPPFSLVDRMVATFSRSDGNIAAVLRTMFESAEFAASLGRKFRDPVHYVMAGVRLAYDDRVVQNVDPLLGWINRMGEPLYGHETPDGYSLGEAAWASAGQMNTRFEIARAIGSNGAVLFRAADNKAPLERPAYPPLAESPAVRIMQAGLAAETRTALAQAKTPQEWNTYLLASPELMRR